jgi:molybdenum cofactor guanylyltransferase
MGRDKALLLWEGRRLIDRAASTLASVASTVVLASGESARYGDLGLPQVLDQGSGGGPLAGLQAALAATGTPWLAVLACDLPLATPGVFERLLERAVAAEADVCLLRTGGGVEPLFGVYRASCLGPVERALERGERKMVAFHGETVAGSHGRPRPLAIAVLELSELPAELRECARNVNTPAELSEERTREPRP